MSESPLSDHYDELTWEQLIEMKPRVDEFIKIQSHPFRSGYNVARSVISHGAIFEFDDEFYGKNEDFFLSALIRFRYRLLRLEDFLASKQLNTASGDMPNEELIQRLQQAGRALDGIKFKNSKDRLRVNEIFKELGFLS